MTWTTKRRAIRARARRVRAEAEAATEIARQGDVGLVALLERSARADAWRARVIRRAAGGCERCGRRSTLRVNRIVPLTDAVLSRGIVSLGEALADRDLFRSRTADALCDRCA